MENLIQIKGYDDYYISDQGNVYSIKSGHLKKLKPFIDGKGNYLMIKLIGNDGIRRYFLLHRLVAIHFIPNPNNLPEVNHKDKNKQNPKAINLEWCTRKDNLFDSYETMSPIRNKNESKLYKNNVLVGTFETITEAVRFAKNEYNVSESSLSRNLQYKNIKIITKNQNRKNKAS